MQSFLVKHQITQVTQLPYSPDVVPCDFWLFQKLELSLKGKRFLIVSECQETTVGQLMAIGRTVWGPKVPTLKASRASLSYVQCFLYLVSSSKNVSIFHITWLDTFWTDLVHIQRIHSSKPSWWVKMEFLEKPSRLKELRGFEHHLQSSPVVRRPHASDADTAQLHGRIKALWFSQKGWSAD